MSVTIPLRTLVAFATGLAVALIAVFVFQAWRVDAAPGDTDSTFVPMTPCRLVDTRPGPFHIGTHGTFGADDTDTVAAHGDNGECSIPADAVGLSLNVTALGATAPTFVTVWPDGDLPTVSSLNPAPGQPPTPNAVATALSGSGGFDVYNLAGSVDLIIDVNGYYTKTSLQELRSQIAALKAADAALKAADAALKAAQPFAASDVDARTVNNLSTSSSTPTEVAAVSVVAPVDGTVTAYATGDAGFNGGFGEGGGGSGVQAAICQITTTAQVSLNGGGPTGMTSLEIAGGQSLAATNSFAVEAGSTTTIRFLCYGQNSSQIDIFRPGLIALFTPTL